MRKVYLDTETTGLSEDSEIVEIAIIDESENVLLNTYVKPSKSIPPDVTDIHGITDAMVAESPTWPDIYKQVKSILAGARVTIYNSKFDVRLLQQTCDIYDLPHLSFANSCAMKWFSKVFEDLTGYGCGWWKLSEACAYIEIDAKGIDWHSALGDCIATKRLTESATKALERRRMKNKYKRDYRAKLKARVLEELAPAHVQKGEFRKSEKVFYDRMIHKALGQMRVRDIPEYEYAGWNEHRTWDGYARSYLFRKSEKDPPLSETSDGEGGDF